MKTHLILVVTALLCTRQMAAQSMRERILIDDDWQFTFGDASSPEKDYGCGTEYFNYLTKAASIHNAGPYSDKFDASQWQRVDLPHDWVVDLPFAKEASHSHGYKTVGHKYPETSAGWYRKTLHIDKEDYGKHLFLQFDGIFRDARIWINGFFLGHEPSGYATQVYDISEYLNYGDDNLICVRADATLEEGWFYEGAGIYRHVWLNKVSPLHVAPFGTFVYSKLEKDHSQAQLSIDVTLKNSSLETESAEITHRLLDADGKEVGRTTTTTPLILAKAEATLHSSIEINKPNLWDTDNPYLYRLSTEVSRQGVMIDTYETTIGIREVHFDSDKGFFLNGKSLKLKGVNMHQDHAGVGSAIPDALQEYRLERLKTFGCNAYRSSHNPMTPEMLDACDRMGILVIEENRLTGINEEHIRLLKRMIDRDRNHPCIILWSIGNEEWGIEWKEFGTRIAASMREYCHRLDPSRLMSVSSSSGPTILLPADVAGYNYILQNPVEEHRAKYPQRIAAGTEETTGCGTRGIYFCDYAGWMPAINRSKSGPDSIYNCIERGWKFYDERPYLAGLFYWTGFDYRGEANPLEYPATGSEFGILDYCGFEKDEAYYLKSWWTNESVIHILPHWNLDGQEGKEIDVWVYSNCDEVQLIVNGKKMERKKMPHNGHLSWKTIYKPGSVKAIGYRKGEKVMEETIFTAGTTVSLSLDANRTLLKADNRDVSVLRVKMLDKKGHFVPTACDELTITVEGPIRILGTGNGNPAFLTDERPKEREARSYTMRAFNGLAQIIIQSQKGESGMGRVTVGLSGGVSKSLSLQLTK